MRQDGFTFLLFGILQFHLGLRITPIVKGFRDLFDVPRVVEALRRGAACKVDLRGEYDLFADKDRPLEEVREELGDRGGARGGCLNEPFRAVAAAELA